MLQSSATLTTNANQDFVSAGSIACSVCAHLWTHVSYCSLCMFVFVRIYQRNSNLLSAFFAEQTCTPTYQNYTNLEIKFHSYSALHCSFGCLHRRSPRMEIIKTKCLSLIEKQSKKNKSYRHTLCPIFQTARPRCDYSRRSHSQQGARA